MKLNHCDRSKILNSKRCISARLSFPLCSFSDAQCHQDTSLCCSRHFTLCLCSSTPIPRETIWCHGNEATWGRLNRIAECMALSPGSAPNRSFLLLHEAGHKGLCHPSQGLSWTVFPHSLAWLLRKLREWTNSYFSSKYLCGKRDIKKTKQNQKQRQKTF